MRQVPGVCMLITDVSEERKQSFKMIFDVISNTIVENNLISRWGK
jgi:hypothetical protein